MPPTLVTTIASLALGIAIVVTLGLLATLSAGAGGPGARKVAYPEGYRLWTHAKSQIVTPSHPRAQSIGGLHHIYGNALAIEGYKSGSFADGSILVFDLLELREEDHLMVEGARRRLSVMEKNSQAYPDTGGWGFENFAGDSHTDSNLEAIGGASGCFACHLEKQASGFVFSTFRP